MNQPPKASLLKMKLTRHRLGRAILHLSCLARGGKPAWHLAGVRRELFSRRQAPAILVAALLSGLSGNGFAATENYYSELFRPQYHFTPEKNWMNDPNGMVFYEGEYHLFYQYNPFGDKWGHMSWGHAVSSDMVHWKHLPLALAEEDGVMIFSGSAVIDWNNSSGFGKDGKPPMVAIYTGYRTNDHLQFQCIAYSNDKGRTWTKYSGNPVINLNSKEFRDPKVQWHEPTQRWIMTVSLSTEHKVQFYGSTNLKEWTLLSEFGPVGATSGVWECPDLFELPVAGTTEKRWALVVNIGSGSVAGGSGGQYFIGQFDGTKFVADKDSVLKPTPEFVPDGKIIANFEGETYGDWKVTGDAFGPGPAKGKFSNQNPVDGYKGDRLVNSFFNGDQTTGTLTSPEFAVTQPFLSFLIGGGAQKETRMDLWVDGKIVRTISGADNERLAWRSWDVREFVGRKVKLQIVDEHKGGWGHINVDQIMLADAPPRPASEPALWFDYGKDYYAAVSWSDVPKSDGRRLWLGWMSNWEYADRVPTSPWRSAMSIAREVGLRKTATGIRLVQQPVREQAKLRDQHQRFSGGDVAAANAWLAKNKIAGDQLEIVVELEAATSGVQGVKVLKGATEETVIGVDRNHGRVFVDRTRSGRVDFHPKFSGVHDAPLAPRDGKVMLHIFVDDCSVEVFVNDGEIVFTDLVFPSPASRGVEFYASASGAKIGSMDVWTLKSSWK
jgi:sucrose-6-phosphate hydrolase SacC (GH32 family)